MRQHIAVVPGRDRPGMSDPDVAHPLAEFILGRGRTDMRGQQEQNQQAGKPV